jgi:hypothetical protein
VKNEAVMPGGLAPDRGAVESLIGEFAASLRRLAEYRLPAALDQRPLWLSENEDSLTEAERHQLPALVELAEEKTVERLQAQATLRWIDEAFPNVFLLERR